jgi:thioredoxin reductase (NADPH)
MAKPILFTIDDDAEVLRAVERDLRREYGATYRVMRADSGASALEALGQLQLRNEVVALFLVDQRMPQMTGVEFLEQAIPLYPNAKRVLLTAYADTDAAIQAINAARIDYYLMKPWDPPEERLYPVLNDLLDDWLGSYVPTFEGIRVIGHGWSSKLHDIKDFLARNLVPYQSFDIETRAEAQQLLDTAGLSAPKLPVVIFTDGSVLQDPTNVQIADKIGLKTRAQKDFYDLIVVGGGPAGLAASVYGASEGLHTLLIERDAPGGQAGTSSRIENYLGFPVGLSGADLTRRAVAQAARFGVEILTPVEVASVRVQDTYRVLKLTDGNEVSCHALLIASGVSYRKLDAPGVDRLAGAGVYYGAALTEAIACRGEDIFIIGGANSAGQAAVYLSKYARTVTMLVRGESLASSMSSYLIEQINATPNIKVWPHTSVAEVQGQERLESIAIANADLGKTETYPAAALFIFIGALPRTEWIADLVERDSSGFVLSGSDLSREGERPKGWTLTRDPFLLESSVPGIFVAGDVRHRSIKRIASAVGEGAMSVAFIHQYLGNL